MIEFIPLYVAGWIKMWYLLLIFAALIAATFLAEGGTSVVNKCFWWFKHKIKHFGNRGYRCSRCGKSKYQIRKVSK